MDADLQRLETRFDADPSDAAAFEALEEHHFVNGEWNHLVTLYERRLESPELSAEKQPRKRARVAFRLAQVLEERCLQVDRALTVYESVARLDPGYQPALVQLRKIYIAQQRWELALQVAEVESRLPMRPFEQANFAAEMGEIWHQRLGDAAQGLNFYQRALEADPNHVKALLGLAKAHEELGDAGEAARLLERAVSHLRGPDRAPALVRLARLLDGPLDDSARAEDLYRRALTDDPRCEPALEALLERAMAAQRWELVSELLERRFDLASGAMRRAVIAHEAGRLHLERLRNPQGARLWFSRALDLFPEDPVTQLALADVERLAGNREALVRHLRRASELAGDAIPADVLREIASLERERGDRSQAVRVLLQALERKPDNDALLDELAEDLSRLGRDEELVEILERQAALANRDPHRCGLALARLGALHEERLGDADAAIDAFERARAEAPERPELIEALERLYRKTEAWEKLRLHLEGSLQHATGRGAVALHCSLGELLLEHFGDSEEAGRCFEAAVAIDATSQRARQGIERIALASGDEDAIVEAFEREAGVTTDRSRLSFLVWELVRIHEGRDQPDEALMWIERLVAAAPEDRRALETCARLQETLRHTSELAQTLERLDVLLDGSEQAANRRRLAELRAAEGDLDGAIEAYQRALQSEPDDLASLRALLSPLEERGRLHELVEVRRHLAELAAPEERIACLYALGVTLSEQLDDAEAALPLFAELDEVAHAPEDVGERLEALLARTERFEALAKRLRQRRRAMDADSPEARDLDLRRAEILLERLGLAAEAASLFREIYAREPESARARDGLESALRQSNDVAGLCDFLAARAAEERDAEARARIDLERATLLEEALQRDAEAQRLLTALADGSSAVSDAAEQRLDALLERAGEWETARDRLVSKLGSGSEEREFEIRMRLGALCRDRLIDPDDAITHLEAAGALRPQRADVWQGLARIYQEEERPRDLLRALESELETQPDSERALLLHARCAEICLEACADRRRAADHYERVLALDPTHSVAGEFLTQQLTAEERHADLARVLEVRLAALQSDGEGGSAESTRTGAEISLRVRIAALRAGPLADLDGAIAILAPAAQADDTLAVVAEPLADLYQRAERDDALIQLCQRAASVCEAPAERSGWHLRVGDTRRRRGDLAAAAESYRQAMAERPEDSDAPSALRDVYRQLGETEPLVRLLEAELSRTGGSGEVPIRMELASLLEEQLSRPADALRHLRRVLQIDPGHPQAMQRALRLAEQTGQSREWFELLDIALERTRNPLERARLLTRRGQLLAGGLQRPEEAIESLRQAIDLDAKSAQARQELRRVLETMGRWSAVLECLELERRCAAPRDADTRAAICSEAAEIAAAHVSSDAALPWLERLRALRRDDPAIVARIAEVHRKAGRHGELLRALQDEIALTANPSRLCALELERAEILEQQMGAPGRAIAALEAARSADPGARKVLCKLERLYADTHHPRERVEILELLIADAEPEERLALRRTASELYAEALHRPAYAVDHLWAALRESLTSGVDRIDLLRRLGDVLLSLDRKDLWARSAEEELRSLDASAPVFVERRRKLQLELARAYDSELGRPDAALRHFCELTDREAAVNDEDPSLFEEAEQAVLRLLRAAHNDMELERRLSQHLARTAALRARVDAASETHPTQETQREATLWLELARLRRERLHQPCQAARAFREVIALDPENLGAIRGLRGVSEQVGDHEETARALEMELERARELSKHERAALYRRLGQVTWKQLDCTTRASRAFAAALEEDPRDLVALRSLQALFEAMEDWRGALDLYESEVEVLEKREPERRQEIWLRVAELACNQTEELERAVRAYEAAAAIGAIPVERRRDWAELYRRLDRPERYVEIFESWVDDPQANACADDHLVLARAQEELGRSADAMARADRALEVDSSSGVAWDTAAHLREACGHIREAAEALERAADCLDGGEAAARRYRAATLVEDSDREWSATLLEGAVSEDPALAAAQAMLARVAFALDRKAQAKRAAELALELSEDGAGLDEATRLETALLGGRAARSLECLEAAAHLFGRALAIAPAHAEALATRGELLFALGDLAGAREMLESRLRLETPDPDRAVHLYQLAASLEADAPEAALERYRDAVELDSGLDAAQAGLVATLEKLSRIDAAVDALEAWAARARDPRSRAERLLRAGELELERDGREEPAEALLREATAVCAEMPRPWQLLAELLWSNGRHAEALELSARALEVIGDTPERAGIALVHARALEKRGDRREAAASYREATRIERSCSEGAMEGARLLRSLGEWREAADLLNRFVAAHPDGDSLRVAPALHQLGRLMAGPLEDVEGAIEVYRRAIVADPELRDARIALAELLAHRPESWQEAIAQHRDLLMQEPVRLASLRALLRISQGRGCEAGVSTGLAVLRALGIATPEERIAAPSRPAIAVGASPSLREPLWEIARRVAQEAAHEIGEALGVGNGSAVSESEALDPLARFRGAVTASEANLTAPALVPLTTRELAAAITLVTQLAMDADSVNADGELVNALSASLGRRARRRVRKVLADADPAEIAAIDFQAWRADLRGLASAVALETEQADLRIALTAWLDSHGGDDARAIPPEADISQRVGASREASALLRRVITAWVAAL